MTQKVWIKIIVGLCLLTSFRAQADVKSDMDEMLGYIFTMKPFIVSEVEFSNPKNQVLVDETLKKMITLSQKINHEKKIKMTGFQASGQTLHEQLKETELVFRLGNKSYSYWLLRSTLSNCMSCHTQLPSGSTGFASISKNKFLTNPFQEAEFLYIIRTFEKSMELYTRAISGFPSNNIPIEDIETAVSRKVFYFTRVKRDLKGLSQALKKDLKNKKLPKATIASMQSYAASADLLAAEKLPELKTEALVRKYAEEILKQEMRGEFNYEDTKRNLQNLRLSGFLYEFLEKNPDTSLKADIYYWLSFCESRWDQGAFDSLPELYLRKCIQEFPKSSVAPQCFEEYSELVTIGYTGSGGTNIPKDVADELKSMKSKLGIKD